MGGAMTLRSEPDPGCTYCKGSGVVVVTKDPDTEVECSCTDVIEVVDPVQRFAEMAAAQFDSELDYDGAEVKRRILMEAHLLAADHPGEGEPCAVCIDDDELDGSEER